MWVFLLIFAVFHENAMSIKFFKINVKSRNQEWILFIGEIFRIEEN